MTTECEQPSEGIDGRAYYAAIRFGTKIEISQLKETLNSVTPGSRNTLLHLAASVGNLVIVQELLQLNPLLVKATNAQGNTALHLAAHGGFCSVVQVLLQQQKSGVDICNKHNETALFKACESGNLATVKELLKAHPPSLRQTTVDGRTCLYVAIIKGNLDLVNEILKSQDAKYLIKMKYEHDDTALHVAARIHYVHIMRKLIQSEPRLCYWVNGNQETPIFVAAKLGHLEAVKELIKERPDAVEIPSRCGMNVLHIAAQVSQVRIIDYLNQKVGLSDLVNKGLEKPPEEKSLQGGENPGPATKLDHFSQISEGDTPLHIAVRNKKLPMVKSLLNVQGINKDAVNKEGLTALDIAREKTEYHESHKIIEMLCNCPPKCRPFLYSAPKVAEEKRQVAIDMVNKTFDARRNTELVVAVLLATMSFTAVFTIPDGFRTDIEEEERHKFGSRFLIRSLSFNMFIIFNCVAFFLSLFVVLAWHITTPLTTEHKLSFLAITNLMVCATAAFTTYGFMAALYTILEHNTLAWLVLGTCMIICLCGALGLFKLATQYLVKMERVRRLCGVNLFLFDRLVESVWMKLESWGYFDMVPRYIRKCHVIIHSKCTSKCKAMPKSESVENV
ncbi:hypothetical protein SUGI_0697330 [Cryptomeria japonica]|uniref:ankyrin repeat-containing protein ITN1-like n=1 Tax=Cryptomeria japonica TaxID=3369 RepID=UPI0024147989|nr:ankyrin repeat-containing protein ITN1-like [Cryptomeria japonica]GLJ34668.1 hypothetical protein SUGI_0697330 [Cryptomeria japonica]